MSARQPHEMLSVRADANTSLVIVKDGELFTNTLMIAAGTSATHEAVIKLVRTYLNDLQEFGGVRFEIQPFDTAGGKQSREIAELNEQQSALLLSYMRNSEIVRSFKKALIRDFFNMRAQLRTAPADPLAGLLPEQRAMVSLMVEQAAMKAVQAQLVTTQATQQEKIERIEAKQSAFENGAAFFTVIGYGQLRGLKFSVTEASALGRKAATLSKAAGIAVDKVRDPRFGQVNSYHESMLDKALEVLYGGL